MSLADSIKKMSQQERNRGMPCCFLFGVVTQTEPLTVRVDNRFDIGKEHLVLMRQFEKGFYPTHYHVGFQDEPSTQETSGGTYDESFAAHAHVLNDDYKTNEDEESEYYYGFAVGEKLVLLRNEGGQVFLILGRMK